MTEKRFPPSAERIRRARKDGKVVKSQLLTNALSYLALIPVLSVSVSWVRSGTLIQWLNYKVLLPGEVIKNAALTALQICVAVLVSVVVVALSVHVLQTRALFRIAPVCHGLRRLDPRSLVTKMCEATKDAPLGVMRALIVIAVAAPAVWGYVQATSLLLWVNQELAFDAVTESCKQVLWRATGVLVVLGTGAYAMAYRKDQRGLMMTLEEVRQEQRDDQGDPHMRSLRKAEAQSIALADLERRVKRAKIIVVRRL